MLPDPKSKLDSAVIGRIISWVFGEENLNDWEGKLLVVMGFEAVFIIIAVLDMFTGGNLHKWGIQPRTMKGLLGILIAPYLHLSLIHLVVNVLPFGLLGIFVVLRNNGVNLLLFLVLMDNLVGGAVVWCLAREVNHIGSSSFVFTFFGFIMVYGAVCKEFRAALISTLAFVFYGGAFWTMLPTMREQISWEMHLTGFIIGGYIGYLEAAGMLPEAVTAKAETISYSRVTDSEKAYLNAEDDDDLDDDDRY